MTPRTNLATGAAGVLLANAVPHAFAAATCTRQMTPLGGRSSGPTTNAAWAAMNVAGSYLLLRGDRSRRGRVAFKIGVTVFSAWVLASEWLTDLNG